MRQQFYAIKDRGKAKNMASELSGMWEIDSPAEVLSFACIGNKISSMGEDYYTRRVV